MIFPLGAAARWYPNSEPDCLDHAAAKSGWRYHGPSHPREPFDSKLMKLLRPVALTVIFLLVACDATRPATDYFPLDTDRYWYYRITRTTMDGNNQQREAVYALPAPSGRDVVGLKRRLPGGEFPFRVDDGFIVQMSGPAVSPDANASPPWAERIVLPLDPNPDSEWQTTEYTSVLENTGPPWETLFRIIVPVEVSYHVESTSGSAQTPAGEFKNCLVVSGSGETTEDVGNYIGRTVITVKSREWYAPGVGLVRRERTETTQSQAISRGALVVELEDWR